MQIRRPLAAIFVSLALIGGGSTMTACSAPGGGLDRNDGTTDDDSSNTDGNDPDSNEQGNLNDQGDNSDGGGNEDDDTSDPD